MFKAAKVSPEDGLGTTLLDETIVQNLLLERSYMTKDAPSLSGYVAAMGEALSKFRLLNTLSAAVINSALYQFNEQFLKIACDGASIIDLPSEQFTENFRQAFLNVSTMMQKNQDDYQLTYHIIFHPQEMASDMNKVLLHLKTKCLLNDTLSTDKKYRYHYAHLLLVLAVWFHDSRYTYTRISDEIMSARKLKTFLKPVLDSMPKEARQVIENLVDVFIVLGTIPIFCKTPHETMDTLLDLLPTLAPLNEGGTLVYELASLLSFLDPQHSSIPYLFEARQRIDGAETTLFDDPPWQPLRPFYAQYDLDTQAALQRKLTQSLRVAFENNGENDAWQRPFADFVLQQQNNISGPLVVYPSQNVNEDQIALFIPLFRSEINFAGRMHHTLSQRRDDLGHRNTWLEYQRMLQDIIDFLSPTSMATLAKKQAVVAAFTSVTFFQDGHDRFLDPEVRFNTLFQSIWESIISAPAPSMSVKLHEDQSAEKSLSCS